MENSIKAIIAEQLGVSEEKVTDAKTLQELGADSLDSVEIFMALEERLGIEIPEEQAEKLTEIGQIIAFINKLSSDSPVAG